MFPLKDDYTPGGPPAQLSVGDMNTIAKILNTLTIDVGEIEKPAEPNDATPWTIKLRAALSGLGGGLPDGTRIPGRVAYVEKTVGDDTTPRLEQYFLVWSGERGEFIEDTENPQTIVVFTPLSDEVT